MLSSSFITVLEVENSTRSHTLVCISVCNGQYQQIKYCAFISYSEYKIPRDITDVIDELMCQKIKAHFLKGPGGPLVLAVHPAEHSRVISWLSPPYEENECKLMVAKIQIRIVWMNRLMLPWML